MHDFGTLRTLDVGPALLHLDVGVGLQAIRAGQVVAVAQDWKRVHGPHEQAERTFSQDFALFVAYDGDFLLIQRLRNLNGLSLRSKRLSQHGIVAINESSQREPAKLADLNDEFMTAFCLPESSSPWIAIPLSLTLRLQVLLMATSSSPAHFPPEKTVSLDGQLPTDQCP